MRQQSDKAKRDGRNDANVFVKPNEQCRACSNIVMARKRTFRVTRKEQFYALTDVNDIGQLGV